MRDSSSTEAGRTCPWCSAAASADATQCRSCGAALAQRDSIADLVIPGVTNVDPALSAYDAQPIRLRAASPSQGMAGGALLGAAMGGPMAVAAIGGLVAVAAAEYLGARQGERGAPIDPASVGEPSEAVRQALERLEAGTGPGGGAPPDAQPASSDPGGSRA